MAPPASNRKAVAAQYRFSGCALQVIDFIESSSLPGNWAGNRESRRIKQLASIWAGSPQSYPQAKWKLGKAQSNQQLGGIPSQPLELLAVTDFPPTA
ncbi:MAG TPA: hypothetical protein PKJ32_05805 [Piscinibacter sp.]|nr:hypothetical protein [Piscinibacter sp.]